MKKNNWHSKIKCRIRHSVSDNKHRYHTPGIFCSFRSAGRLGNSVPIWL